MSEETETVPASRRPQKRQLPALSRGETVGRYVILDRLGHGGMGVVYRAFDPDLDRRIALKLVRSVSKDTTARLMREAQALAKVAHPNIVSVFDVGEYGDTVFIAMELIEGKNLHEWVKETQPDWRTLVGYLVDAGRGLAAAHAAGLVHRDFKPHNVIVGTDGRVRVLDFGVARKAIWTGDEGADEESDESGRSGPLPRIMPSRLTGTWGYMAPEQRKKQVLDARADQFAFGVSAWEVLFGQRPFEAETQAEYAEAAAAGRVRQPPANNPTPAWVRRVLLRTLSPNPDDRYRSMDDVLSALTTDPARRRWEYVTAGIVISVAAAATFAISSLGSGSAPCEDAARHMDGVWDQSISARLDSAFRASGASFAGDAAAKVRSALDKKRDKWVAMHREACRATRITGEQSTALLDLRMSCLAHRKRELGALVTQLVTSPDAARVAASVEAVAQLPAIDACADRDALAAVIPPPPDPARRADIDAAGEELATINAMLSTGQWPDARSRAERVQARAKQLDFAPLVAEAGLARGLAERLAGSSPTAELALAEAAQAAARAHLDETAARVWSELAWVVGYEQERAPEGLALAAAAEASALRASATPLQLAEVAHTRATILLAKGDQPAALKEAERALSLLASAPEADFETADMLTTLAMIRSEQGDYRAAEAAHRQALARRKAALGEAHPKVADSLDNLGVVLFHQGAFAEAKTYYEQALALRLAALGPGHRDVGTSHNNLGGLAMEAGDAKSAQAHLETALAIYEKALGPTHADLAIPLSNLGELAARRGDFAQSLTYCTRALGIDEAAAPDDPKLAYDLVCIGEAHIGAGSATQAIAPLERALALRTASKGDDGELARTQFALARALPGSEKVRAKRLATTARAGFAAAGEQWKARLGQVDAWLATPR